MRRLSEEIKKDVVDQIYWDDRVDASYVQVEVADGKVKLRGTVPTFYSRTAANEDAWLVAGVSDVEDDMEVKHIRPFPGEADLASHIESILAWNPDLDAARVTVREEAGIVTLEGSVDALWKKYRAEDLAANVAGVIAVTNKLAVVPTENIVDETIAEEIVKAVRRNSRVDVDDVDIRVERGVATISGVVPSWVARRAVVDMARYTPGVIDVVGNLVVTPV